MHGTDRYYTVNTQASRVHYYFVCVLFGLIRVLFCRIRVAYHSELLYVLLSIFLPTLAFFTN